MRLENNELRALRAVVEEGGFLRAAESLHISQSAVSQTIAGLESKLDALLVVRGKVPRLTEAGRRLFDHADKVLREEQQTLEDIAQLREGRSEMLNVALAASVNYFYGPMLISTYYQQNPHVRMKIADLPSRSMIYAVLAGNIELGFGPFQKDMPAFDTVPLYRDSRHLVISPRHPFYDDMLAGDQRALKRTPLIASALDNPDLRPSIQRLRDQFSTVWEVNSLRLRIHMVAEGMGVTFLERKLLDEHPFCKGFRIMDDISFGRIDRQVGLYFRSERTLSESANNFISMCENVWTAAGGT